ncbi:hypothetical protein CWATWH8502_929 [Crocosphaera watsonii WH 8502]|nr:hypothetical protein CWATWH0003_0500 [Crocosphaera watsonii WH 0003]CCQ52638.1 hypothetical protein CWATWH8502_929 [Crocosphaera watsonii WH 8502]CCQ65578.1 hypothetical protein CWATWH0402_1576 [Crocosphaera watsonii WH 0402]
MTFKLGDTTPVGHIPTFLFIRLSSVGRLFFRENTCQL